MTIEQSEVSYGSKRISVAVNTDTDCASFRIGRREPGWIHPKLPGDTTITFLLAQDVVQDAAERIGRPVTLRLDTANSTMKLWLIRKREFFGFDSVEPDGGDGYRLFVSKRFYP